MITVNDIKFLYTDRKYQVQCLEFCSQLEVENSDYDTVIKALEQSDQDYTNIKLLSYTINKDEHDIQK